MHIQLAGCEVAHERLQGVADDEDVEAKEVVGQQQHRPHPGLEVLGGREDEAAGAAERLPHRHTLRARGLDGDDDRDHPGAVRITELQVQPGAVRADAQRDDSAVIGCDVELARAVHGGRQRSAARVPDDELHAVARVGYLQIGDLGHRQQRHRLVPGHRRGA